MVTRMLQLSLLPSSVVAVNVTVVIPTGNSKLMSCELEIFPTLTEGSFHCAATIIELLPMGSSATIPAGQEIIGDTVSTTK